MSSTEYLNMKALQENRFDEGRRLTNMWLWQKGISSSFNQCIFLPKPMYVIHGTDLRWFDKKNLGNLIYRSNKQVLQMMLTLPLVAHFFNANFVEIWMLFFFQTKTTKNIERISNAVQVTLWLSVINPQCHDYNSPSPSLSLFFPPLSSCCGCAVLWRRQIQKLTDSLSQWWLTMSLIELSWTAKKSPMSTIRWANVDEKCGGAPHRDCR